MLSAVTPSFGIRNVADAAEVNVELDIMVKQLAAMIDDTDPAFVQQIQQTPELEVFEFSEHLPAVNPDAWSRIISSSQIPELGKILQQVPEHREALPFLVLLQLVDVADEQTRFDELRDRITTEVLRAIRGDMAVADFDMDGSLSPLSDGILGVRFMAGFRGTALVDGVVNSSASAFEIEARLDAAFSALDIDGDGDVKPLSDGLAIMRAIADFEGLAVTENAINVHGSRGNSYQAVSYMRHNLFASRPLAIIHFQLDFVSVETKQRVEAAEQKVEDAKSDLTQAETDLQILQDIKTRTEQKIADSKQNERELKTQLTEIDGRIAELEKLAGAAGAGRLDFKENDELVVTTSLGSTVVGKVVPDRLGGWNVVTPDGAVMFGTEADARQHAMHLGQNELDRVKRDAENAAVELPGQREKKVTVEEQILQQQDAQKNAVQCAKDEVLNGVSDDRKVRINKLLQQAETPEDVCDAIKLQEENVTNAATAVTTAKEELTGIEREAADEAAANLDKEIADKSSALETKRDRIAADTVWLDLAGSILKQLEIQIDFDAAAFSEAVGDLGDKVGDLPLPGAGAAGIAIQAGGAALTGIIKIQSWMTQQVLTSPSSELRTWINNSSEFGKWLKDKGVTGGDITPDQTDRIKFFIDKLLIGASALDFANSWSKSLDELAGELADLQNKRDVIGDLR